MKADMKLIRKYSEDSASIPLIQLQHRRDAIGYAVECIKNSREDSSKLFPDDIFFDELNETWHKWIIETLYQGAYIREYHLWEKDCKYYFSTMAQRNKKHLDIKTNALLKEIEDALRIFHASVPPVHIDAIREMNRRVNVMKHDPGLMLGHFIAAADYEEATTAIEQFWETLEAIEEVNYQ